jgi:hypothetical protein
MKKRKITILIAAVMILVAAYACYQSTKVYGNDKESIIKVIKSVEGYEDKDIHVVKINDFDDVRIVGFLANHNPSYIEFAKKTMCGNILNPIKTRHLRCFYLAGQ